MEDQTVQTLLSLQELDATITKLREERRALQAELEEIDEMADAWSAGESEQRTRVEETAADVRRAERKVKAGRETVKRLKERQKRLRSQRELEAAKSELDTALANLDDAETTLLEEMQAHDRARIRMEDMDREHGEEREEAESRVGEIEARLDRIDAELQRLDARRGEAADSIDQDVRSEYDRVRGGRTDQALAPVVDGVCGHCFT
ncbi:MAG: zinc ribbon domain-containing protein, partial [Gemmatimonadota bacterium]